MPKKNRQKPEKQPPVRQPPPADSPPPEPIPPMPTPHPPVPLPPPDRKSYFVARIFTTDPVTAKLFNSDQICFLPTFRIETGRSVQ
jgi:hypothetical protein